MGLLVGPHDIGLAVDSSIVRLLVFNSMEAAGSKHPANREGNEPASYWGMCPDELGERLCFARIVLLGAAR
jgi:hypothetical protein